MGFVAYFLITWDFIHYAKSQGIPVGPGSRLRGGLDRRLLPRDHGGRPAPVRPALRALPEPRAHLDAGHRHRLLPGRPRADHPLRPGEVRRAGPRQPDHHVRAHGGPRGDPRRRTRAWTSRSREVDRLAKKIPNGPEATLAQALEADPDLKRDVRRERAVPEALRRRAQARGAQPARLQARRRRGDRGRTARGVRPALQGAGRHHHAVLHGHPRGDRPPQDGLPGAAGRSRSSNRRSRNIRKGGQEPPDLDDPPADDPETFAMLAAGEALGVFQLESAGMRELLRRIQPDRFDDLSIIIALYRPGPMGSGMVDMFIERKHGREPVAYPHPVLEPILEETHGVIVYQEQVMRIANLLAGFSLTEADNLRKAMGKKKPELLAKFRQKFVDGCEAKGLARDKAEEIWAQLEHFAGYGFNKCHTAAYARHHVPDRLPQGALPARVHGRPSHLRDGGDGQGHGVRRRGPAHGHRGAAARRLALGRGLHRRGREHPLRTRGDQGRGARRRRGHRRCASGGVGRRGARLPLRLRSLRARGSPRREPRGDRGPREGGGLRLRRARPERRRCRDRPGHADGGRRLRRPLRRPARALRRPLPRTTRPSPTTPTSPSGRTHSA